jgi:hypothetical protein
MTKNAQNWILTVILGAAVGVSVGSGLTLATIDWEGIRQNKARLEHLETHQSVSLILEKAHINEWCIQAYENGAVHERIEDD